MFRPSLKSLMIVAIVAATVVMSVSQAEATWWRGCYRPAYSYAPCYTTCYTPCYTTCCYTPCYTSWCDMCHGSWYLGVRPGPIRRLAFGPYRWYYGGCGCGCYGCGCHDYSCCYPCCQDVGVCGPVTEAYPKTTPTPAPAKSALPEAGPNVEMPGPQVPAETKLPGAMFTPTQATSGLLTVWVPAKAKVFINGMETKTIGSRRRYVSHGLKPGMTYKYEVRVDIVRDGKIAEETQTVYMTAGANEGLAFGFNTRPVEQVAVAQ